MIEPSEIRKLREDLGESQEVFGARFGVTQTAVSLWETKGPPTRGPVPTMLSALRIETVAEPERASA